MTSIPKPIPKLGLYLYTNAVDGIAIDMGMNEFAKQSLTGEMAGAIREGKLRVRNPYTGAPTEVSIAMDDPSPYVTVDDVNDWLAAARYPYQWQPDSLASSPFESTSTSTVASEGLTGRKILAHDWPLQQPRKFRQSSLKRALSDIPKWLEPAIVVRGKRGVASTIWNPSQLAACLHERGYANQKSLTRFFAAHFPDWCDEWARHTDALSG